jgi:hypothetical protein
MTVLEKPLSNFEIARVVEILVVIMFMSFSTYQYAKRVPAMEERIASHEVRVSVLESRLNTVQASLDRIENAVSRRK